MAQPKRKLAYVTSHPIQYQAPLFRAMSESAKLDLKVFFCSDLGQQKFDPGFGTTVDFGVPLKDGFQSESPVNLGALLSGRLSLINPGLPFALRRFAPHSVVVHGYYHVSMLLALLSASSFSRVYLRGESNFLGDSFRPRPRTNRFLVRLLLRRLHGVAAIGSENARFYRELGVSQSRIFMTPYSVDNHYFQSRVSPAQAIALRESLGIPVNATVLGFVGKLSDVKGSLELLTAFERVKPDLPNVHLVFVGDGPNGDEMRRRASSCSRTHLVGFQRQEALAGWYQAFDTLVLPSLFEPWGLVVNEAMNYSIPVLVSDRVGAAYDLVEGHDSGWIFRANKRGALERAIRKCCLMSPEERRRKGDAAFRRINRWGIQDTVRGFERLIGSKLSPVAHQRSVD